MSPRPALPVFTPSHFCEKARWALGHFGIGYELVHLAPGAHAAAVAALGAERSTLPVLVANGEAVQGSAAILDWSGRASRDASRTLRPDTPEAE